MHYRDFSVAGYPYCFFPDFYSSSSEKILETYYIILFLCGFGGSALLQLSVIVQCAVMLMCSMHILFPIRLFFNVF